jgi:GNAT superfamily N-acetyltransferase
MIIRPILATDYLDQMWPLLAAHREELTVYPEIMQLSPDVETYLRLEDAGKLLSLGVFDGDELIGYSVNIVTRNLHYDLRVCHNDVLYLTPEHRLGPLGLRLIRDTERHAREAGAELMLWHAKQGTALDGLLPRLDYQVQEIMYSRVL